MFRSHGLVQLSCLFTIAIGSYACSFGKSEEPDGVNASAFSTAGRPIVGYGGKCVDDDRNLGTKGDWLQMWDCNGTSAQEWVLDGSAIVGPGGKCLDVRDGNAANGTPIQLWDCNGTPAQRWQLANGQLVGLAGKCLDVTAFGSSNGTHLELWDCNGGSNQQWVIGNTVTPPPPQPPGKVTGGFRVSAGAILGPDGGAFIAKGINAFTGQMDVDTLVSRFPGINFVRLATSPGSNQSDIASFVNALTARKIVVEIEDHSSSGGNPNTSAGQALANETAWFAGLASTYINNPYVWFGTANEPDNTANPEAIADQESAIYKAVRDTGNKSVVMMEMRGGFTNDFARTYSSSYSSMTNVVWDVHFYGWVTGWYKLNNSDSYSTDQATIANALAAEIADAQSVRTADGAPPVIVGEFGPSTTGLSSADANGTQVVQTVLDSGYGFAAWAWNAGTDNLTDDSANLTGFGRQVAARIGGR